MKKERNSSRPTKLTAYLGVLLRGDMGKHNALKLTFFERFSRRFVQVNGCPDHLAGLEDIPLSMFADGKNLFGLLHGDLRLERGTDCPGSDHIGKKALQVLISRRASRNSF